MNAFYSGYETVYTISEEERKLIPMLGACLFYFYLGIQCNRFNNWSNTFINEVYLKRYIVVFITSYYETTQQHKNIS
jgi:Ser/Thr protein kinase RdoA (MazF antagonist)